MAGFFGLFDYNKPGKGVDVEAPPKHPFIRFWELYWRKFSRFIVLNLLVFLFLLPITAFLFLLFHEWLYSGFTESALQEIFGAAGVEKGGPNIIFGILQDILISAVVSVPPPLALFLLVFSAVFYGPVMCGATYILRNFSREEHAWMSDFFVQMRKNFRQGTALGLFELVAFSLLLYNITTQATEETASWLAASLPAIKYVSVFLIVLLLFARLYIYAMAVTFSLPLFAIIKNAFAFIFVGLFRNAGVVLGQAAMVFLVLFVPVADLILMPFFFFSFTGFLTVFATFPLINKHMLLPALERKRAEEEGAGEDSDESEHGEGPA